MDDLQRRARKWLPYNGPNCLDKGRGWALNHPIQKLIEYKNHPSSPDNPPTALCTPLPPPLQYPCLPNDGRGSHELVARSLRAAAAGPVDRLVQGLHEERESADEGSGPSPLCQETRAAGREEEGQDLSASAAGCVT